MLAVAGLWKEQPLLLGTLRMERRAQ